MPEARPVGLREQGQVEARLVRPDELHPEVGDLGDGAQQVDRVGERREQRLAPARPLHGGDGCRRSGDARAAPLPPVDQTVLGEVRVGGDDGPAGDRAHRRERALRRQPVAGAQLAARDQRLDAAREPRRESAVAVGPPSEPCGESLGRHLAGVHERHRATGDRSVVHWPGIGPVIRAHES